jgi:hypothetical protein
MRIIPSGSGALLELTQLAVIVWQGITQDIAAIHPGYVTEPSEVNRKVKHPVALLAEAWIVPGLVVPLYVPISGAPVEFPSKICKASSVVSVWKALKTAFNLAPAVPGQIVNTWVELLA